MFSDKIFRSIFGMWMIRNWKSKKLSIYINVYIYTLHIPQKCVQFAHALSLPSVQPFLSWIGIRKETSNVEKDEAVIFFSVPSYNYYSSYSSQYGNTYFAGVLQNGLPTIGKPTVETSWNFLGKHRPMGRAAPSAASAVKRAHTRCGLQPSESGDVILKEVWLKLRLPGGLKCGVHPKKHQQMDQSRWYLGLDRQKVKLDVVFSLLHEPRLKAGPGAFEPLPSSKVAGSFAAGHCASKGSLDLNKLHN